MKGKRGSSYTLVFVILFIGILFVTMFSHSVHASMDDVAACNYNGGIWCGPDTASLQTACKGANVASFVDAEGCDVYVSQNVTLDKDGTFKFSDTNLKTYEFNYISVYENVRLQFYLTNYTNTIYPKAVDATCAAGTNGAEGTSLRVKTMIPSPGIADPIISSTVSINGLAYTLINGGMNVNCDASYPYGGGPLKANENTSALGGKGGNGGREGRSLACDIQGGGGGAGAGGGKRGVAGGDGSLNSSTYYSGGSGSEGRHGVCGGHISGTTAYGVGGSDGGRAGGFVKIKVNQLTLQGNISVNGEDGAAGAAGRDYNGAGEGGFGGGPGAGGGGAGKIVVEYNTIQQTTGFVTANGGNGGAGGAGSNGNDCANGAPGGGGGAGNGGIVSLSPQIGALPESGFTCVGGIGGSVGAFEDDNACGRGDRHKTNGTNGQNGMNGVCGVSELSLGYFDFATPQMKCNDRIDNIDQDGEIDMNDVDCVNYNQWDGSVWHDYNTKPAYYDASARNINDLVCGDDESACITVQQTYACKVRPTINQWNICQTKYSGAFLDFNTYGCDTDANKWDAACQAVNPSGMILGTGLICMYNDTTGCGSFTTESECTSMYAYCSWQEAVNCSALTTSLCEYNEKNVGTCAVDRSSANSDLGLITGDNKYLCSDSWSGGLSTPGHDYAWLNAEGDVRKTEGANVIEFDPYTIFQADKTQFISNGAKWFQCNAMDGVKYTTNDSYLIAEYGTFTESSASDGDLQCINTLEKSLIDFSGNNDAYVYPCSDTWTNCENECDKDGNCKGICTKDRTYTRGDFKDGCGNVCEIQVDGESKPYMFVDDYYDNVEFKDSFCSIRGNALESDCAQYVNVNTGNSETGSDYMDQGYCKLYPELCVGGVGASSQTCQAVHERMNYVYTGDDNKICSENQYCKDGILLQTSDADAALKEFCCLGQNSYCEEFVPETCESIGGDVKPSTCQDCVCSGIEKDDCCINGKWNDYRVISLNPSDAFICYKEEGNSLIKECCGSTSCYNGNNKLNKAAALSSVDALGGVPLHGIMSFDDISSENSATRVRSYYNKPTGYIISGMDGIFTNNMNFDLYSTNWSGFAYLEFDILYNDEDYVNYMLNIVGSDANCSKNIADSIAVRKGPSRWQHVRVDITDSCARSVGEIRDLTITLAPKTAGIDKQGITVLLDNFFLRTANGNSQNSDNRFCSGNWGDWVENLDGPVANDDRGFYGNTTMSIAGYGPYRDACEGVISFGWTGSVCCGDDTRRGAMGEYWADSNGACWNGTTVTEGKTVADALGINPLLSSEWDTSLKERSLLFYKGELLACDLDATNFSNLVSFNGLNAYAPSARLSNDMTFVSAYSVRGEWFCQPGNGWTKLADVNRLRILAAAMKGIAENQSSDYTLMCGKFADEVNTFMTLTDPQKAMTNYTCVLRIGDNRFEGGEKVIVGLEMQTGVSYDAFKTGVLGAYPVLNINEGSDECANLPNDILDARDDFFTNCANDDNNNNNFYIYYSKPMGLLILSDGLATERSNEKLPFLKELWEKFKAFFARLFKGPADAPGLKINDFDTNVYSRDFYISVQGNRTIRGVLETTAQTTLVNVEYVNFSTSVEILSKAIEVTYPAAQVVYVRNAASKSQGIFVTYDASVNVDWRLLTSILRVVPQGDAGAFLSELLQVETYNPSHMYDTVHETATPSSSDDTRGGFGNIGVPGGLPDVGTPTDETPTDVTPGAIPDLTDLVIPSETLPSETPVDIMPPVDLPPIDDPFADSGLPPPPPAPGI
jgi:hypothetical protein